MIGQLMNFRFIDPNFSIMDRVLLPPTPREFQRDLVG